jgi:hypothetical protein
VPKVVECFFQVSNEAIALSGFYNDVVDIDVQVVMYLLFEVEQHTSLVCGPHVL